MKKSKRPRRWKERNKKKRAKKWGSEREGGGRGS